MEIKKRIKIISYIVVMVMLMTLAAPIVEGEYQEVHGESRYTYRVLEIEPTNFYQESFDNHETWQWKDFISSSLSKGTNSVVQVSRMTSAEFNGKEEDLVSNYDLIYIGVKTSEDDDDFGGYDHMGKQAKITEAISDKGERTQKSGNDITADKKEELLSFAKSGGTVIVSSHVYGNEGRGEGNFILDKQSNMSDLLVNKFDINKNDLSERYKNVICCDLSEKLDDNIKKDIGKSLTAMEEKCTLNILEQPIHNEYINKDDINNRELKYTFNIGDSLDKGIYKAELFIDLNSDGKYAESENMSRYMQMRTKGGLVKPDELKEGTEYILTRDIGDYVGIIYWKLKITKVKDGVMTTITDEVVDYCKIQPKILVGEKVELVKKNLKILQIMANEGSGSGLTNENSVWLPTAKEADYLEANYASLVANPTEENISKAAKAIEKSNADVFNLYSTNKKIRGDYLAVTIKFWLYTRNLDEFKISVERIPVSAFQDLVNKKDVDVNNYEMLILGFADCYTDITEKKALEAIDGFIKDGKTILFTHDTTSFVEEDPYTGAAGGWGYNINRYFRNMLGMDRYGFLSQVYDFDEADKTDKDYVWNQQGRLDYKKRAHGYTDYLMDSIKDRTIEQKRTQTITAINSGQISTYPYDIPEDMGVALTHGQYYQLDLEANDVVVWYCLSGGEEKYYGEKNRQGVMEKDARNNYYIYNRSNLTYSGAGHDGHLTDNEIKLFINTMVGAYRAASTAVSIEITNPDASRDKSENAFFQINYLKEKPKQPIGSNIVAVNGKPGKRVFFYLKRNAVNTSGKMSLKFGDISTIYDKNGVVVTEILADTEYYVDVPLIPLEGKEKMEMNVVLTITYKDDTLGTTIKEIKKKVTFMRKTMFNLN